MKYPPTRDSLIKLRNFKKTIERGLHVLKKKQQALVSEILREIRGIVRDKERLDKKINEAYEELIEVMKRVGVLGLYSIAYSYSPKVDLEEYRKIIAGVKFVDYTYRVEKEKVKEYELELSPLVYEIRNKFKDIFLDILKIARRYYKVKVLLEELKKVRRRINSIEKRVLPSILENIKYISERLDDLEKEEKTKIKILFE